MASVVYASAASASGARTAAVAWTPQQRCLRHVLRALRAAYYHDRSKLFWARHRALVEFYKYAKVEDANEAALLVGLGNEVADFVTEYMKTDVERIVRHNEKILTLPVAEAKKYREEYLLAEKQHDVWCKQRIRAILDRRPPPPYPFY